MLGLLTAGYLFALVLQVPNVYDEGLVVDGAVRILHGQIPYKDFNSGYPPGQFYTIAGIFSIFGKTLLVERMWDITWRLAVVGFAVVLARAVRPNGRAHPMPLICIVLVTGVYGSHLYSMIVGMLPCLIALWLAVLYLKQSKVRGCARPGWRLESRFCIGTIRICMCGSILVAVVYRANYEGKLAWVQLPVFSFGLVVVVAFPILYFWVRAPHGTLLQAFVDFPRANFAGRHLPLPLPDSILAWCEFYLPLAVVLAMGLKFRQTDAQAKPSLLLLWTSSLFSLGLSTQRLDLQHAYPAVVFSLVTAVGIYDRMATLVMGMFVAACYLWLSPCATVYFLVCCGSFKSCRRSGH